jgi:hypothetical protein
MKSSSGMEWVGIDLHVHTPASKDYQGPRGDEEYLALIEKANEFAAPKTGPRPERPPHGLGCIALTDHNSVEGFKRHRTLREETTALRDSIRLRDPNNVLIPKLEKDIETLSSLRVLMGCEVKANPGIHLLLIFHESVQANEVTKFLEEIYGLRYEQFAGDPTPTTAWTLQQVLDGTTARFGEKSMIVAPHVDSGGGLYEGLKDFQQLRMLAFKHTAVSALSFNKPETREKITELLRQPEYRRSEVVALVQSSDYHGQAAITVGQPRSEVYLPGGKATFSNIREAFRVPNRVKCSCDFTQEEYDRLTKSETVIKFQSDAGTLAFRQSDYEKVAVSAGALLNWAGGILDLQGTPPINEPRETYAERVLEQLRTILDQRLDPPWRARLLRDFRFSPSKTRFLVRVPRGDRLRTVSGTVYVVKNGNPQRATAVDIESIVSRNINRRFGERFEETLGEVSNESVLLAKVPRGIPIVLEVQEKLAYTATRLFRPEHPSKLASGDQDQADPIHDLYHKAADEAPLGMPYPEGNLTLPLFSRSVETRFPEHYLRFTTHRTQAPPELLEKLDLPKIEKPTIAVFFGGGVSIVEPGRLASRVPLVLLGPPEAFAGSVYALAAWLKSSFMVWYCAVHLGDPDLFLHMQLPTTRFPMPRVGDSEVLRRLDSLVRNVILDENKLMKEINKQQKSRGDLAERATWTRRFNVTTPERTQCASRLTRKYMTFWD